MDFVKVLKLNQGNLRDGNIVNVIEDNKVKLSTYNFLIKALEICNNRKFKNDETITEFIKINLPENNEEKAYQQWFDGVTYNGYKYFGWFATVNGMKQQDNGFCETIFVREDYKHFASFIENLISLGKFDSLEGQEIYINKDVLSRISLITTDLISEIDMPNFIILPEAKIDWIRDYKTVKPYTHKEQNSKGEYVEHINYELIDYHFDTNKRNKEGNPVDEINCFDGGGIATPKVFESIGESLNRNDIEFAIIRGYGAAIKGLITKFDIIGYLDFIYKGDTYFCKKIDEIYYIKDMWNEWQPVTDNTMLLNESMVKLAKYFTGGMSEYKELMQKLNNDTYRPYYNLVNKLYITKVNKPDREISDYRRTNYQLINALALTPGDYKELTKQDIKLFKKILKPYECIQGKDSKEFVENIDYINLFFKQCINVTDEDSEEDIEEKSIEMFENVIEKTNELLNINSGFVKLQYVKNNLAKLVEKKIREFASGRVTIKAKYQYIAIDPISYMNYAINRSLRDNGLNEGEFYSVDCNNGDTRTIQRNPLAAYSEVHNVKFVRNKFLDKWLCKSKEIIYFNQKSDIYSLLSGADSDGDAVTVIDNSIIKNAVVTPIDGKYFRSLSDGEKQPLPFNKENRFISTYQASGNLIGKIALKAANVNSNSQNIPDYYSINDKKFLNKNELKDSFEGTDEEFKIAIKEKINNGEYLYTEDSSLNEELREYIKQNFYANEKDIYIILYNTMRAIDSPKTLSVPDIKRDLEVINSKYIKKVYFLQYTKSVDDVKEQEYIFTHSLMDRFASYTVENELLSIIQQRKSSFRDRADILQASLKNEVYSKEIYPLCYEEIEKLYSDYTKDRKLAEDSYNSKIRSDKQSIYSKKRYGDWLPIDEEYYASKAKEYKAEKYVEYKAIDTRYYPVANKIIKDFDLATVCQCIADLKICTENFILSLFFNCLEFANNNDPDNVRYSYVEDENGDVEYLYKKYRRIEIKGFDNSKVVESINTEDKLKLKLNDKIRFKLLEKSIVDDIEYGLKLDGFYELDLSDTRVQAFGEFEELLRDKDTIKVVKIDKVNEKSIGLIVEI